MFSFFVNNYYAKSVRRAVPLLNLKKKKVPVLFVTVKLLHSLRATSLISARNCRVFKSVFFYNAPVQYYSRRNYYTLQRKEL